MGVEERDLYLLHSQSIKPCPGYIASGLVAGERYEARMQRLGGTAATVMHFAGPSRPDHAHFNL